MMNFVLKVMNFVLKMMNFVTGSRKLLECGLSVVVLRQTKILMIENDDSSMILMIENDSSTEK